MSLPLLTCLIIILITASVTDLLNSRIPNAVTFPGMGVAVAWYGLTLGLAGLTFSGAGLLLGLAVFMPFYLLGGMGAGDVKMMGAVGAFLGPTDLFYCILFVAVVGGVYALGTMAGFLWGRTHNREKSVLRCGSAIGSEMSLLLQTREIYALGAMAGSLWGQTQNREKPVLRYGLAIGLGTSLFLFTR